MKTCALFLLLFGGGMICFSPLLAQKTSITNLQLGYVSDPDFYQSGSIRLKFTATYADGRVRSSKSFLLRHFSMLRYKVRVKPGRWYAPEKQIFYDLSDVYKNGGKIMVSLQDRKDTTESYHFEIPFPVPVRIRAVYDSSAHLSPGHSIPIDLEVGYSDGKHISTRNGDRLAWPEWRYINIYSNVKFTKNKELLLSKEDYLRTDTLRFQASFKGDTLVRSEMLMIPLDYNGPQHFDFAGSYGGTGGAGSDGKDVNVWVMKTFFHGETLLHIRAQSGHAVFQTRVNPVRGKLLIDCRGGNGGDGQDGSDGMNGNDAMDECPATNGNHGGNGGDGGKGGDGGDVFFYTDAETEAYLHLIEVQNHGGSGGDGGSGGEGEIGGSGGSASDGYDGSDGSDGMSGRSGNAPQRILIPRASLAALFEAEIP